MIKFLILIIIFILYLFFERKWRYFFESSLSRENIGTFDKKFLSVTQKVANIF